MRNMQSIGLNLAPWVKKGLLRFEAMRPTLYGLETHLVNMERIVDEFRPKAVIIDPISNLIAVGSFSEVKSTLTRLVDFLKTRTITAIFTSLVIDDGGGSSREVGITTLMDTWILLSTIERSGEYNRLLYIRKSRGMAHSNQVREFLLTDVGIQLTDVYLGESGVLTGAAKAMQEAHDQAASLEREQEVRRKQREYERSCRVLEAQIAALKADIEYKQEELNESMLEAKLLGESFARERQEMARIRRADTADPGKEEASSEPKEEGKP
jgi:circadian clock protein KaiC